MSAAVWMTLAVFLILGATLCWSEVFILASEGRARSGLFVVAFPAVCSASSPSRC